MTSDKVLLRVEMGVCCGIIALGIVAVCTGLWTGWFVVGLGAALLTPYLVSKES